jgi:hypothetical protein
MMKAQYLVLVPSKGSGLLTLNDAPVEAEVEVMEVDMVGAGGGATIAIGGGKALRTLAGGGY